MFSSDKSNLHDESRKSDDRRPLLSDEQGQEDIESRRPEEIKRHFVKIKSTDCGEVEVDISPTETVDELKARLIPILHSEGKRVRLISGGKLLDPGDKRILSDFINVQNGSFIHAVVTNVPSTPSATPSSTGTS
jgi:Ubiquitin family